MLTTEALRYCNNRIQELAISYDNETIQKLRDIVECLFSYLDGHDIKNIDYIDIVRCFIVDVRNKDKLLCLFLDDTFMRYDKDDIEDEAAFDLHNINKLFDWVFEDENR